MGCGVWLRAVLGLSAVGAEPFSELGRKLYHPCCCILIILHWVLDGDVFRAGDSLVVGSLVAGLWLQKTWFLTVHIADFAVQHICSMQAAIALLRSGCCTHVLPGGCIGCHVEMFVSLRE